MAGRPIDEKIVAMKMDNSDFKQKVAETTGIFGKLRDAFNNIPGLNMDKVTKSFGDIESAAQRVNLSSIAENVDKIAGRFSNMGIVAMTALSNITNKVVDLGLQMGKSIVLDPIMDGFREYETKIGAIGTVLSNTQWAGTNLTDVKRVLGDLNTYADQTIYDFGQMTDNLGRFTAAGVKIDDAAIAIKGLSNLAAASGSNVDQMNTAMYQMSQALASGTLNLEDWNSLVNAGMAGKKTQDALVATARAMGKNVDLSKGFRDSIHKGWLTSAVLLETLKKFGADKSMVEAATKVRTFTAFMGNLKESIGSGWATTFELIFGDFDQATNLWTGLAHAIGGFFNIFDDARNNAVKSIADAGIFKGFFDIITSAGNSLLQIFTAIGNGISKAFSGTNTGFLQAIGKAMEAFATALIPSASTLKDITTIFQALFSIVKVILLAFAALGKILISVIKIPLELIVFALHGLTVGIGHVLAYIGSLVIAFTDAVSSGKNLHSSLGGLKGILSAVGAFVGKVIKGLSTFGTAISDVWNVIKSGDISKVGPWAKSSTIIDKVVKIRDAVKKFASGVVEAWNILVRGNFDSNSGPWGANSKIVEKLFAIRSAVQNFVGEVVQAWNILTKGNYTGGPWDEDSVAVDKLFKIRESVQSFIGGVVQAWNILAHGNFVGGPWEEDSRIVNLLFNIREAVQRFVGEVVQAWNILVKGNFTGGPWDEDSAIVDKLFKIRESVQKFVSGVVQAWQILTTGDFTSGPWSDSSTIVAALLTIRHGVEEIGNVFAKAGQIVVDFWNYMSKSKQNFDGPWNDGTMEGWLSAVGAGLRELGKAFGNLGGAIAQAWSILSQGIVIDGPWSDSSIIVTGLFKIRDACIAVGKYLASLHLSLTPVADAFKSFFKAIGDGYNWLKEKLSAIGKAIADAMPSGNKLLAGGFIAAMVTISAFVLKFWYSLVNGFAGWMKIGNSINELLENVGGAFESFSKTMRANNIATIMISTAIAVGLLALSLKLLSTIKSEKITSSLIAITTVISALIGGMAIITKYDITGTGMKAALQMVAMGLAISIMVGALKKLSGMSAGEIAKGIMGLVGIMGSLAGAMVLMSKFGGAKIGASALQFVAIGAALYVLLGVVKQIATVDTGSLVKGITVMGIMLLEMAAFLKLAGGSKFGISSTLGMLAIGRAIMNITDAVQTIATINTGALVKGLTVITIILAEITAFAKLTSGSGLLSAGVGMLFISAAMMALAAPIGILGNMDMSTLVKGLGAMTVALVAIGAASKMLQGSIASGAGLILMAAGLSLLLIPIGILSAMSWGALVKGMVGLAGILLIVGGAALVLAPAVPPLLGFAAAIGLLGLAMLAGGAGMTLFATGLVTLASLSAAAITTIVATFGSLIVGISSLIPMAVDFVVSLMMQILSAITTKAPQVVAMFAQMLVNILNVIAQYIPPIVDAAVKIITNFLDALSQHLPEITDSAAKLMVAFISSLSNAVQQNGPQFIASIMSLLEQVMLIFVQAGVTVVQALFGWIPGVNAAASQIGSSAEQTIKDAFKAYDLGSQKGADFASGLNGKTTDANTAGNNLANSGKQGASTPEFVTTGNQKGLEFINGFINTSGGANAAGNTVSNSGKQGAATPEFNSTGIQKGQEFINGLNGGSGGANAAGNNLSNSGKQGAATPELNTTGIQKSLEFVDGLQSQSGNANSAGNSLADHGKQGAQSVDMKSTGNWFGEGFASGIGSSSGSVWDAAVGLATKAKSAVEGWLGIHSPSRVMMESGGWFGDGFAIGITNKVKVVADKAKGLAMTAKDSLNQFIDGFELPTQDNELHFKAVIDYASLDPSKFGSIKPITVAPNTSVTTGNIDATRSLNRQNVDINTSTANDDRVRLLLSDIKDNINRIDPNKPVYLVVNDKVLGQSVTKNVIDNYDMRYMKAERGLADA